MPIVPDETIVRVEMIQFQFENFTLFQNGIAKANRLNEA